MAITSDERLAFGVIANCRAFRLSNCKTKRSNTNVFFKRTSWLESVEQLSVFDGVFSICLAVPKMFSKRRNPFTRAASILSSTAIYSYIDQTISPSLRKLSISSTICLCPTSFCSSRWTLLNILSFIAFVLLVFTLCYRNKSLLV